MRANHKDVKSELKKINKEIADLKNIEKNRLELYLNILDRLQSLGTKVYHEFGDKNIILWFLSIVLVVNLVLTCVILARTFGG